MGRSDGRLAKNRGPWASKRRKRSSVKVFGGSGPTAHALRTCYRIRKKKGHIGWVRKDIIVRSVKGVPLILGTKPVKKVRQGNSGVKKMGKEGPLATSSGRSTLAQRGGTVQSLRVATRAQNVLLNKKKSRKKGGHRADLIPGSVPWSCRGKRVLGENVLLDPFTGRTMERWSSGQH